VRKQRVKLEIGYSHARLNYIPMPYCLYFRRQAVFEHIVGKRRKIMSPKLKLSSNLPQSDGRQLLVKQGVRHSLYYFLLVWSERNVISHDA
jgi:hypothetical protein